MQSINFFIKYFSEIERRAKEEEEKRAAAEKAEKERLAKIEEEKKKEAKAEKNATKNERQKLRALAKEDKYWVEEDQQLARVKISFFRFFKKNLDRFIKNTYI